MCLQGSNADPPRCTHFSPFPQKSEQRVDYVLDTDTPRIREELDRSLVELAELSGRLPRIRARVADIQSAYNSGRKKVSCVPSISLLGHGLKSPCQAQELVNDLVWLNTDFHERWRLIIFTSSAPVSWRWKVTMRLLFGLALITSLWIAWVAIRGVYRAHRQRLVWGERLMS